MSRNREVHDPGDNQVTIFVKPSDDISKVVKIPEENEFVAIKNIFCSSVEGGKFKLLCHFFDDQVQILRQEVSSVKEIMRRLESLPLPNQVCKCLFFHSPIQRLKTLGKIFHFLYSK